MTTAKKLLTADDLLAMPDDGMRRELIQGELIEMPPASDDHGFVGDEFSWRFGTFIRQHGLGRGRLAETGFQLAPDTVLAPDYAYISYERMADRPQPRGYAQVIPDLVVEVATGIRLWNAKYGCGWPPVSAWFWWSIPKSKRCSPTTMTA